MQLYECGNNGGEILDGGIIQTSSNKEIDTTKNKRKNEGFYVIVNISPISN